MEGGGYGEKMIKKTGNKCDKNSLKYYSAKKLKNIKDGWRWNVIDIDGRRWLWR